MADKLKEIPAKILECGSDKSQTGTVGLYIL